MNDLDVDLDRNTPWVDMSACVKFGLDRPSGLAGHTEHRYRQTNKHNAFYYIDDDDDDDDDDESLKLLVFIVRKTVQIKAGLNAPLALRSTVPSLDACRVQVRGTARGLAHCLFGWLSPITAAELSRCSGVRISRPSATGALAR